MSTAWVSVVRCGVSVSRCSVSGAQACRVAAPITAVGNFGHGMTQADHAGTAEYKR